MVACSREKEWFKYIAVSLCTFLIGFVILLLIRILRYCSTKTVQVRRLGAYVSQQSTTYMQFSRMRAVTHSLVSGNTTGSKGLIIAMWVLNMVSCLLFLIDATNFQVEECGRVIGDLNQSIWLALCAVFILHFILRFIAATDKLSVWINIYSVVDCFTIVPSLVGLYLDRNWIGFRFLRMLYLLQVTEILQIIHVLRSRRRIRIVRVAFMFLAMWFTSSGFVHLCENNGDPHHDYDNSQYMSYWTCVYWLLVTMSTVGFGDIYPTTDIGKAFIVFFIMGSFAMFTSVIPELGRAMGHTSNYTKPYKRTYGKKHIVVCGHITYESVTSFLKNFIHADTVICDTHVVFLGSEKPNLELSAYFHRNFSDITFFLGSALDSNALSRVKMDEAEACIMLSGGSDEDPDVADTKNILRVTAVKNFCAHIRVIVQLQQHRSKRYLLHIPNWNWDEVNGDSVVCISELKLAIMAQNCLAPGAATLITNLFSRTISLSTNDKSTWMANYQEGAKNEIYEELFSRAFYGVSFQYAAQVCFHQFNLLLIAMRVYDKKKIKLMLNPHDAIIHPGDAGIFIAQSRQAVRCIAKLGERKGTISLHNKTCTERLRQSHVSDTPSSTKSTCCHKQGKSDNNLEKFNLMNSSQGITNNSGLFHCCVPQSFDDTLIDLVSAKEKAFCNHVVVTLSARSTSSRLGLVNLVAPLRTSNIPYDELKDVIFVTPDESLIREKEWEEIRRFPKLFIFIGEASNADHLRCLRVNCCAMCVVLSGRRPLHVDMTYDVDEDAILNALSVKHVLNETPLQRLDATTDICSVDEFRFDMMNYKETSFIVQLEIDSNIALLGKESCEAGSPLYLHESFASGQVFVSSCLDSLVSCTYINSDVLILLRALITGSEVTDSDEFQSNRRKPNSHDDVARARDRCRLNQLSLVCGPLERLKHNLLYGDLFCEALRNEGILCLGIYRLVNPTEREPRLRKRYVITNPHHSFRLIISDKVFVLQPFNYCPGLDRTPILTSHSQECLRSVSASTNFGRRNTSPLIHNGSPSYRCGSCACFDLGVVFHGDRPRSSSGDSDVYIPTSAAHNPDTSL